MPEYIFSALLILVFHCAPASPAVLKTYSPFVWNIHWLYADQTPFISWVDSDDLLCKPTAMLDSQ